MAEKLNEALSQACVAYADTVAVSGGPMAVTYQRLAQEAERVREALCAAGVTPDEPVLINVSNHPLDLAALFGTWNAGAVAVPVHRSTPDAVAVKLREKTRARFLVDMLGSDGIASTPVAMIAAARPPDRPLLKGAAFVIFTSGSTGSPKGVVVSHAAFHGKIGQIDHLLKFRSGEQVLLVLNITFCFGLWVGLLTLLRGGRLIIKEKFEPGSFLQALVDERVTRVGMVPTMMRVLFSNPAWMPAIDHAVNSGALQQILIGGESLGKSLAATIRQRFKETDLVDIYGLTETSTCDFFSFPEDFAEFPGCIGRPSPHVQFRIVGSDGAPAGPGTVGELQIRSPYLMNGYLDDPVLTAAAYSGDWFRTGDLARVVGQQVVELMGRSKELISRGGNKVTPGEIEQLLGAHPDVAAAMAVGVADRVLGERIHAMLVPRAGEVLDLPEIRKFLENKLEKFKQPDTYYIADSLPLGRTGKADRGQFKSLIESGAINPVPVSAS